MPLSEYGLSSTHPVNSVDHLLISSDDSVVIAGRYKTDAAVTNETGTNLTTVLAGGNAGTTDAYVMKLTTSGTFVFWKAIRGITMSVPAINRLRLDSNDQIFIGMQTNWPNIQLVDEAQTVLGSMGDVGNSYQDICLAAFTSTGTFKFWRKIQGSGDDYLDDMKLDPANNLIVSFTRRTNNTRLFNEAHTALVTFPVQVSTNEPFILKLDNDGVYQWYVWLSEAAKYAFGYSLQFDSNSNIFARFSPSGLTAIKDASGTTLASIQGDAVDSLNQRDNILVKLTSAGALTFAYLFTSPANTYAAFLPPADDGRIWAVTTVVSGMKIKSSAQTVKTYTEADVGKLNLLEFAADGSIRADILVNSSSAPTILGNSQYVGDHFYLNLSFASQTSATFNYGTNSVSETLFGGVDILSAKIDTSGTGTSVSVHHHIGAPAGSTVNYISNLIGLQGRWLEINVPTGALTVNNSVIPESADPTLYSIKLKPQ